MQFFAWNVAEGDAAASTWGAPKGAPVSFSVTAAAEGSRFYWKRVSPGVGWYFQRKVLRNTWVGPFMYVYPTSVNSTMP